MARFIKPPRKAKACANCLHFAPTGTAYVHRPVGGIYHTIGEQARGDCRARPPKPDRASGQAVWSDVLGSDFCGTFVPRETKTRRTA